VQVKPLLQVTGQEEKLHTVESEMQKAKESLERQKQETEEMERKYAQIIEEKSILAEHLQDETERCAEAEEVWNVWLIIIIKGFLYLEFGGIWYKKLRFCNDIDHGWAMIKKLRLAIITAKALL